MFYSMTLYFGTKNRELSSEINPVSFGGIFLRFAAFHKTKFMIEPKDTNLQKAKKLSL